MRAAKPIARLRVLVVVNLLLAACQTTGVSTLAPNMVRLDLTGAQAPMDTELAFKQVLTLAARETLAHGYAFFRFKDWTPGPTRIVSPSNPVTANFAVTIVMSQQGEQTNAPAFDARQIVAQSVPPAQ